jgi:hypothetical protein
MEGEGHTALTTTPPRAEVAAKRFAQARDRVARVAASLAKPAARQRYHDRWADLWADNIVALSHQGDGAHALALAAHFTELATRAGRAAAASRLAEHEKTLASTMPTDDAAREAAKRIMATLADARKLLVK